MENNLINSIDIAIQNLGTPTRITLMIALIGLIATIFSAVITVAVTFIINLQKTKHDKQWAYIIKRSVLIDNAIDVLIKMMFTKLQIADHNSDAAKANFFALQKDALLIECQLIIYASEQIGNMFYEFKNKLINLPPEQMRSKWSELYKEGGDYVLKCRQYLGQSLRQDFDKFSRELTIIPPTKDQVPITLSANTIGTYNVSNSNDWKDSKGVLMP